MLWIDVIIIGRREKIVVIVVLHKELSLSFRILLPSVTF
jgi:hypothetical protein